MKEPTTIESAQLDLPCQNCGAAPGEWCRMPSGKRAEFHESRYWAALAVIDELVDQAHAAARAAATGSGS